jgi:hypothetical protein
MTLHGHIQNGEIVLAPHGPLPEGAEVQVRVLPIAPVKSHDEGSLPTLAERLKEFIGCMEGLPEDAAINHDHYLYGVPKVQ